MSHRARTANQEVLRGQSTSGPGIPIEPAKNSVKEKMGPDRQGLGGENTSALSFRASAKSLDQHDVARVGFVNGKENPPAIGRSSHSIGNAQLR